MVRVLSRMAGLVVLLIVSAASAEDAFYRVPLNKLQVTKGEVPAYGGDRPWWAWRMAGAGLMPTRVRLQGVAEGYCDLYAKYLNFSWGQQDKVTDVCLLVRASAGQEVMGRLDLPKADLNEMVTVEFRIPASAAEAGAREAFYRAKRDHYERLLQQEIPGAAWFRHEAMAAARELGAGAEQAGDNDPLRWRGGEIERTYDLFTGGRALSENLQLDRVLPATRASVVGEVKLESLKGIDIREMDWGPLVKDLKVEADPLASIVPADQHAIFFPTFDACVAVLDEADRHGTPVLQLLEPRSEDARTQDRYQRQLCLSLTGVGRLLGPRVIDSVAVTGSDPYLRMGSDMAILFEAKDVEALRAMLAAQIAMGRQSEASAKTVAGQIQGVAYMGAVTPDRAISVYLAVVGNAVVVSNSLKQMERLIATQKGQSPSIASLPEYTFFRGRYKRGDAEESAFLVLTDATIRRWCGPRWRIADSRRTRAAAIMTSVQADHMDALVKKTVRGGPVEVGRADAGQISVGPGGVVSSVYGNLEFMTPIVELDFDTVTQDEASDYQEWRDRYQQYWRQYFDPIAARLTVRKDRLAVDVTVMPLIAGTEYREFVNISRGAKLAAGAGDPHDALAHFIMAINRESNIIKMVDDGVREELKTADLRSWLGAAVSVYADDDPYWEALRKEAGKDKPAVHGPPIALRIEVADRAKLDLFLAAARAWVDRRMPDTLIRETLDHKQQPYVKVSVSAKALAEKRNPLSDEVIYHVAMADALVISPNENVIKRAIERGAAKAGAAAGPAEAVARPWLGSNAALRADRRVLETVAMMSTPSYQTTRKLRAWGNIPILNEWKRLFSNEDPVKLHERLWQTRLLCPGGGRYVWNEQWQTMESTMYGHPGQPKSGPAVPPGISDLAGGEFGLDFEDSGLRARAVLQRK